MIAYLSGAMENAKNEGQDWRKEITLWLKNNLDHQVIDPVEETAKLVRSNNANGYRKWKESNPQKFINFVRKAIDNDLNSVINKADYVICLWNNEVLNGGGTHGEVTMAYYFNKPVYLINLLEGKEISGWIMSCSSELFSDFDELKDVLKNKYGEKF